MKPKLFIVSATLRLGDQQVLIHGFRIRENADAALGSFVRAMAQTHPDHALTAFAVTDVPLDALGALLDPNPEVSP